MGRARSSMWNYVTVIGGYPSAGTKKWYCNFCLQEHSGGPARIKTHLSKLEGHDIAPCPNVPHDVSAIFISEVASRGRNLPLENTSVVVSADSQQALVIQASSSQPSSSRPSSSGHLLSNERVSQLGLSVAQKSAIRREATLSIRKCFYKCNLPFHIAETPAWREMISNVAKLGETEFHGPTREHLRTSHLEEEFQSVMQRLEPIRSSWKKYGCSILTDGWTDMKKRPILNIMVSSCQGTIFLDAVDASELSSKKISGHYIYKHIKNAIDYIGAENIVQVITDNQSNFRKMGRLLMEEFQHIQWTPCAAHCIDLLIEDIANLAWVKEIVKKAAMIVNFFIRKPKVLSIYRSFQSLEILKFSITRFGYMFLVLERLLKIHPSLQQTVVSDAWREWDESKIEESNHIKNLVLGDNNFWKGAENIILDFQPIFFVLRITDCEGCTMGLLYMFMTRLSEALNTASKLDVDIITKAKEKLIFRWTWFQRPIHIAAYILHPLWRHELGTVSIEVQKGWIDYLNIACTDHVLQNELEDSLLRFLRKEGCFSRPATLLGEPMLKPISWWEKYGREEPHLQRIALRVLSQDCSSSASERNWSAWGLVQTKRRNRLSFSQMKKILYVQTNLRILENSGGFQVQEVNPDSIDITKMPTLPSQEDFHDSYAFLYEKMPQPCVNIQRTGYVRSLREAYSSSSSQQSEYEDSVKSSQDMFEEMLGIDSSRENIQEDSDSIYTSSRSSLKSSGYEDLMLTIAKNRDLVL